MESSSSVLTQDGPPACVTRLQEEMYSFVTVAEDQTTKNKGTVVVQDS